MRSDPAYPKRILAGRPFHSLTDFLTRVAPRPQESENLIKVGGLRGLGTIPGLLARIQAGGWSYGQPPLFELAAEMEGDNWDLATRAAAQEAILGVSVDAHPLELVADQIDGLGTVTTLEALDRIDEQVRIVGVRQTTQRFHTPEGDAFYILELGDLEGVLPVMMSAAFYRQHRKLISSRQPLVVEGRMTEGRTIGDVILRTEKIWGLV